MTEILADYLEIHTKYPAGSFLSKAQRIERYQLLNSWVNNDYEVVPTFAEVVAFMSQNDALNYESHFLMKVLIPRVVEDVEQGSIEYLKFLFECDMKGYQPKYVGMCRNVTNGQQYGELRLVDMVLEQEPDNEIVLNYKHGLLARSITYTFHGVPHFVFRQKEGMPELLAELQEFTRLSERLDKNNDDFIGNCRIFYQAWEQYLNCTNDYNGFKDYLIKHSIDYDNMTLRKLKNSQAIHDVLWLHELHCDELTDIQKKQIEQLLFTLIHDLENIKIEKLEQLQTIFDTIVVRFEAIVNHKPLCGIYDYSGLNYYFGDIVKSFGFPVEQGAYSQISNFVYPDVKMSEVSL